MKWSLHKMIMETKAKLLVGYIKGTLVCTIYDQSDKLKKQKQYIDVPGELQLNATHGSYVYINPEIRESAIMVAESVARNKGNLVVNIDYEKTENMDIEKHRNSIGL
nr:hypothetical protein [Tanacetum cinerariifolium]